jgi:hypothetical protein
MKIEGEVKTRGTQDVICDRCNKSTAIDGFGDGVIKDFYYGTLSISGGYFSPVLPDGVVTTAHLCEACWAEARKLLEGIGVKFKDEDYF